MVVLSHSWSPFLTLTCLYRENELLWGPVCPSGVFSQENIPPSFKRTYLGWDHFTKLLLSNNHDNMKYGKNDKEWLASIPSISLSDLGDIWGKEKEALSMSILTFFISPTHW